LLLGLLLLLVGGVPVVWAGPAHASPHHLERARNVLRYDSLVRHGSKVAAGALGPAPVVHGRELAARELLLPAGWGAGEKYPGAGLSSVACGGPQECVVVGSYSLGFGAPARAMVATETNGVWGRPVAVAPRGSDGVGTALVVSCGAGKRCVVVRVAGGMRIAADTSGVWGPSSTIELPVGGALVNNGGNRAVPLGIDAVTCTGRGDCVAVGSYTSNTAGGYQALAATETNGVWGRASEVVPPADATPVRGLQNASLDAVTCTGRGACVAVGTYYDKRAMDDQGLRFMAATETGGVWGQARTIMLPAWGASAALAAVRGTAFTSVSCASPRDCTAVGFYPDTQGIEDHVMAATETNGMWGRPREVMLPANADATAAGATLNAVTCTSAGNCVAVGGYAANGSTIAANGLTTANALSPAMIAIETHGMWRRAVEVALPADASTQYQTAILESVACASQAHCVAVGGYNEEPSPPRPMVVSFALKAR